MGTEEYDYYRQEREVSHRVHPAVFWPFIFFENRNRRIIAT